MASTFRASYRALSSPTPFATVFFLVLSPYPHIRYPLVSIALKHTINTSETQPYSLLLQQSSFSLIMALLNLCDPFTEGTPALSLDQPKVDETAIASLLAYTMPSALNPAEERSSFSDSSSSDGGVNTDSSDDGSDSESDDGATDGPTSTFEQLDLADETLTPDNVDLTVSPPISTLQRRPAGRRPSVPNLRAGASGAGNGPTNRRASGSYSPPTRRFSASAYPSSSPTSRIRSASFDLREQAAVNAFREVHDKPKLVLPRIAVYDHASIDPLAPVAIMDKPLPQIDSDSGSESEPESEEGNAPLHLPASKAAERSAASKRLFATIRRDSQPTVERAASSVTQATGQHRNSVPTVASLSARRGYRPPSLAQIQTRVSAGPSSSSAGINTPAPSRLPSVFRSPSASPSHSPQDGRSPSSSSTDSARSVSCPSPKYSPDHPKRVDGWQFGEVTVTITPPTPCIQPNSPIMGYILEHTAGHPCHPIKFRRSRDDLDLLIPPAFQLAPGKQRLAQEKAQEAMRILGEAMKEQARQQQELRDQIQLQQQQQLRLQELQQQQQYRQDRRQFLSPLQQQQLDVNRSRGVNPFDDPYDAVNHSIVGLGWPGSPMVGSPLPPAFAQMASNPMIGGGQQRQQQSRRRQQSLQHQQQQYQRGAVVNFAPSATPMSTPANSNAKYVPPNRRRPSPPPTSSRWQSNYSPSPTISSAPSLYSSPPTAARRGRTSPPPHRMMGGGGGMTSSASLPAMPTWSSPPRRGGSGVQKPAPALLRVA